MKAVLCVLTGVLALQAALAEDVTPFELGCEMQQWTIDDGMPSTQVRRLAQTPDGYLWVGCSGGLARFNGSQFTRLSAAGKDSPEIHAADFWVDEEGVLWVLDARGRLLKRDSQGLQVVAGQSEVRVSDSASLFKVSDHVTWLGHREGSLTLWQYAGGHVERLAGPLSAPSAYPGTALVTQDGMVWAASFFEQFGWLSVKDGRMDILPVSEKLGRGYHFFRGQDGRPQLLCDKGLGEYVKGEWRLARPFETLIDRSFNINEVVEDRSGRLWIGTQRGGLWVMKPGEAAKRVRCLPERSTRDMSTVLLAADGSVYAAGRGGLFRFRPSSILKWPTGEDIRHSEIASISETSNGTLWFAGHDGVFCLPQSGSVRQVADPEAGKILNQVEGAGNDDVWLSGFSADLWRGNDQNWQKMPTVAVKARRSAGFIRSLADTGDGNLWISTRTGLLRFHEGRYEQVRPQGMDLKSKVEIIAHGQTHDELLAGLSNGCVMRWRKGAWETLVNARAGAVNRLTCAPDGTVWYARNKRGLGCWREGRQGDLPETSLTTPDDFTLAADDAGGLWLAIENTGVWRLDAEAVAARCLGDADGPVPVTRLNSMPDLISRSVSDRNAALYRARDGRIWVAGLRGVSVIDPAVFKQETEQFVPAPVKIETVQAGSRVAWERDHAAVGPVIVQAAEERFELHFAVLGSSLLGVPSLRCRLEGYESDFQPVDADREISYSGVPPGKYTFRLQSLNSGGTPVHQDHLELVVLAHWWERRDVQTGGAVLLAVLLIFAVGRKIRGLRLAGERRAEVARRILEAEERERKRVASELHDGLGQQLLVMKNLATLAGRSLPAADATGAQFKEIADSAGHALAEVRSISRALRPPELDRLGLTKAIRAMANRVADSSHLQVECHLPDTEHALTPEQKIAVFRILQEALNNALRHSGADRVSITLRSDDHNLTVMVEDNGRGFSSETIETPGIGLQSMRERAALMRGRLEISSQPGAGTRVQLLLPLAGAKATTHS